MDARSVIAAVRDGRTPEPAALGWFARGLADGTVTDAQAGAFAMAVLLKGLGEAGRRIVAAARQTQPAGVGAARRPGSR